MTQPNMDKIRRCAARAMHESAAGYEHLAYTYADWIKRYCEEFLYEDLYYLGLDAWENES